MLFPAVYNSTDEQNNKNCFLSEGARWWTQLVLNEIRHTKAK